MFNSKKSVTLIVKSSCNFKEDKKSNFPSFVLADQVLVGLVVNKFRYLGHIIRDDFSDDDDIRRLCCKLYPQANMLAWKFKRTDDVKIALFRLYCTSLYFAHLWCSYSVAKMKKLQVADNYAFRILLGYPRWTRAICL